MRLETYTSTNWKMAVDLCERSAAVRSYERGQNNITIEWVDGTTDTFADARNACVAIRENSGPGDIRETSETWVDQDGRSPISKVNGEYLAPTITTPEELGAYGRALRPGDLVTLNDEDVEWGVDEVCNTILVGPPGACRGNYVVIKLSRCAD